MKNRRQRLVRGIVAITAAESAWWLCLFAGLWPTGSRPVAAFAIFAACVFGLDRLYSLVVDLVQITFFPLPAPVPGPK